MNIFVREIRVPMHNAQKPIGKGQPSYSVLKILNR
jgi:hypothetical protein